MLSNISRKLKGMLIESAAAAAREAQLQAELRAAIEGGEESGGGERRETSGGGDRGGQAQNESGRRVIKWRGSHTAMEQPPSPRALLLEHRASALERKR